MKLAQKERERLFGKRENGEKARKKKN